MQPSDYSKLLFTWEGRITRKTYWLYFLVPYTVIYLIALVVDVLLGTLNKEIGIGLFTGLLTLLLIYPSIVVVIKRLHDRNRSGWFLFLFFVPFVGLWPAIETYFLRGTRGPNRFGEDPIGQVS